MTQSSELLARYARSHDEAAFAELVAKYFDLVYSVALRQLHGDTHRAQDVAQIVFTDLARKAHALPPKLILAGWLHEAARFTSNNLLRTEHRRHSREQKSFGMLETSSESNVDWEHLRPVLDLAIGQLKSKERDAVLLRFFEDMGFPAIGQALGISEDAANKRVIRALNRLRKILARRGLAVSTSGLTVLLMTGMATSAPAGLAGTVATTSLAASAASAPLGLVASLKLLLSAKIKTVAVAAVGCLLACTLAGYVFATPDKRSTFAPTDLGSFYNGTLASGVAYPGAGLTNLSAGRHVFGKVPFVVYGTIHLQGEAWREHGYNFPVRVDGIPIRTSCHRIHLLHATSGATEAAGTKVGSLIIHYSDGAQEEIALLYGQHVLDWWDRYHEKPTDHDSAVAWTGRSAPTTERGYKMQLFQSAFNNPHPDKEIETIDYVSAMTRCAPVMLAMTTEK